MKPSDADIKAAEEAASRSLREEFGLVLSRRDFDGAFEQELGRCLIQETTPPRDLADLTPEKAILRIFVRTQIDSIWPAKLVAEFAVHDELARLRTWIDDAILRVKDKVRKRYNTRDIRGSKHLQETATRWAGGRAKEVFQPYLDMLDEFDRSSAPDEACRPKAGRPAVDHDALDNFGLHVVRYLRTRQDSPQAEDYPFLVGLLWVVSGAYPFGYSDDSRYLLDRAVRVAGERLKAMDEAAQVQLLAPNDPGMDIPRAARLPGNGPREPG